jgi:5-hydroxyisourate hydrolase
MTRISTHILDIARGHPAENVSVRLERQDAAGNWQVITSVRTDQDGRCAELLPANEALSPGFYRLHFDTANYFAKHDAEGLYPFVEISFQVREGEPKFHIPLLLSPHGYTTYRGS